jgi:hypothetical protein
MIDKEQAQHMTDVAGECNRLNEISQPLGYAVTATTSLEDQSTQQFTVHRLDQTAASGPKFATTEEPQRRPRPGFSRHRTLPGSYHLAASLQELRPRWIRRPTIASYG